MKHAEVVIARQALEEGRGLVVIVNKMDLLRGKQKSKLYEDVIKAVPEELQKLIPQVWLFGTCSSCFSIIYELFSSSVSIVGLSYVCILMHLHVNISCAAPPPKKGFRMEGRKILNCVVIFCQM